MFINRITRSAWLALIATLALTATTAEADPLTKLRMDFATYNPVSLVLKEQGLIEKEFAQDGIAVEWTKSAGSNVALEGLDKTTIDFGSSAGAAALMSRAAGSPIKSIYVFSRPEWTALVVPANSPLKTVADLKGKKVAVTKGTDPHIFLLRALETAGLTDKDIIIVPLQHADGWKAMAAGEVDAWAGLDAMMAQAELGSRGHQREHVDRVQRARAFHRCRRGSCPGRRYRLALCRLEHRRPAVQGRAVDAEARRRRSQGCRARCRQR